MATARWRNLSRLSRNESPPHTLVASRVLFSDCCPRGLGTDLIYIKSEDHYLEVHTTVGSSLIKMRFSDAVAELGDRGVQVHRSYWVANGHVTRSVRNGKRTLLRLTGDHKVPVSATYLPAVRAMLARSRHSASLPPQAGNGAHV